MRWAMILLMFLLLGAFFIISNGAIHVGNEQEFDQFKGSYDEWVGDLFSNAKGLIGYVVKSEWLPYETGKK